MKKIFYVICLVLVLVGCGESLVREKVNLGKLISMDLKMGAFNSSNLTLIETDMGFYTLDGTYSFRKGEDVIVYNDCVRR